MANDAFAPVAIRNAASTAATGINDNGLICGFFVNMHGVMLGFVKPQTGGAAVAFRVPGSAMTQLLGVNNAGQTVGFYMDAQKITHGLYYNPANGQWQRVDDPNGVGGSVVNGLNNKGQLVGFYTDAAGNVHGMVVTVAP